MNLEELEKIQSEKDHFENIEIEEIYHVLSVIGDNISNLPIFIFSNQHYAPELYKQDQITQFVTGQHILSYDQNKISTLCKMIYNKLDNIKNFSGSNDPFYPQLKDPIQYFVSFQSEHILAASNTLRSIDFCYHQELLSDAFVLLRKYRDDLLQYLIISSILTKYCEVYDDQSDKSDHELKSAVETWLFQLLDKNLPTNTIKKYKKFFSYASYSKYLKENISTKKIFSEYFQCWDENNEILNNFVHVNSIRYIAANIPGKKITLKEQFFYLLHMITDVFLSCEILLEGYHIRSDDHISSLEIGVQPPEGSEYWISENISQYLTKYFSLELRQYLYKNNRFRMEIPVDKK